MDSKDHSMDLEDPIFSEEAGEECGLGVQINHTLFDKTYFQVNHHCGEHLYLFYNAAKAYSPKEFSYHFLEFKNYYPEAAFILKHELSFEKWSSAYFPGNRFDVMTINIVESVNAILIAERENPVASIFNSIAKMFGDIFRERHAYILKYKDNKFFPAAEKILRDNTSEGDSFYVENVSGDEIQFTVFGSGCTVKVDLLERSCSFRKFDVVKIPCDHAMAVLRLKHGDDYGLRVYDYSLPVYKVEEYLFAYSESINIVPLESEWRVPQELLDVNIITPLVVTKLRRKKIKRVKGVGETFKSKRRNKCSLCKRPGLKRTTCNNNKS
ncbi:hypothetical protein BC332_19391 [Capsicum chinense]|nr:hypothetical protein BC332_19391 [Capsicum chinense]